MAKTIKWSNPDEEGIATEDRVIKESETKSQTLKREYTLKQKQENIDNLKVKIAELQNRLPILEAELATIKTTLNVTGG